MMILEKQTVTLEMVFTIIATNYRMIDAVTIAKIFGMNDGGKLLRRHLRAKFAVDAKHEFNQKWIWMTDDAVMKSVVTYFYDRMMIDAEWVKSHTAKSKTTK